MNMDVFLYTFLLFIMVISILIGVSFLALMERKGLGLIQYRKGPNKVSVFGILQSFGDAVKLFSKEQGLIYMSNFYIFYGIPMIGLLFSLLLWISIPMVLGGLGFNFSVLYFLCVSSLGVYFLMMSGWLSNSTYSLLGGLRSVAQSISYEVIMSLYLICFLILTGSLSLMEFLIYQDNMWFLFLCYPVSLIWLSVTMAETNRSPFDFSEGESELVSGFNVEYGSIGFALIFMGEYSSILFMSVLFVIMLMGSDVLGVLYFIKIVFVSFIFIWVRASFPRFRYDKLMEMAWKIFLFMILGLLLLFFNLKLLIYLF